MKPNSSLLSRRFMIRLLLIGIISAALVSLTAVGVSLAAAFDDPTTDLGVTKTAPDNALPNTNITYSITVTSTGPDSTEATLTDNLPSGTTFVSVGAPAGWTCSDPGVGNSGTVSCSNGSYGTSEGDVFTLVVHIDSGVSNGTFISNTATVASSVFDTNDENNSSTASTLVAEQSADVGVFKSVPNDTVLADSDVSYTITVANSGPDTADSVSLSDTLPGTMTFVSLSSPAGWSCTTPSVGSGGTISCSISSLTVGAGSQNFTLVAHVPPGTEGNEFTNVATVATSTFDPNSENQSSSAGITVATCLMNSLVTTTADSGSGSLRQAVSDTCTGGTIAFASSLTASGPATITLTEGEIAINKVLTINGPTSGRITISGNNNSRIFDIQSSSGLTISNLTFSNGTTGSTPAITSKPSSVQINILSGSGGGAIFNLGALTILNSTFTGNYAGGGRGGAIDSEGGTLRVINSTISGNRADLDGGGVANGGDSTAKFTNVTITNNRADADNNAVGSGGGLAHMSSNTLTLNNTIVAGNFRGGAAPGVADSASAPGDNIVPSSTPDDIYVQPDNPSTSGTDPSPVDPNSSNNLIGVDTGLNSAIINGVNGNQVGTSGAPIDPKLKALANYGGPTATHLLLPNSPALNAGKSTAALDQDDNPLTTDQRGAGFPRIVGSAVDIGSVEVSYMFSVESGTPQTALINTAFAAPFKARVQEYGVNINGVTVSFSAPASGPSGSFSGSSTVTTDSSGIATAPTFAANGIAGTYNVTATLVGTSLTGIYSLKNIANTTTTVTSSLNPSLVAQSVTFTATVTSAGGTPTGSVQFKDGATNLGPVVTLNASGVAAMTVSSLTPGVHVITAVYSGDSLFNPSSGTLSPNQTVTNRPLIKFSSPTYSVNESGKFITITVNRMGDTTTAFNVDFATPDDSAAPSILPCSTPGGVAIPRCDFTTALGTLRFASGQTSATFVILITEDAFLEGNEDFPITLLNPTNLGGFVQPSDANATVTIVEDETTDSITPDDPTDFVRQHYHDFLNREPDPAGLAFWVDNIMKCEDLNRRPPNMSLNQCLEVFRVDTSAAFFLSIEFQNTGYFVERMYKAGFGDINPPSVPVPVRFTDFLRDTQDIRGNVIVGQGNWQTQLDNNKAAFALAFVQRSGFLARYPGITSATAFVDSLNTNAGNVLTDTQRSALIAELSPNPADPALRADVLRKVADNTVLQQRETNRAFVMMQYFGYLRRNPDAAPETSLNFDGFNFWLNKLNSFNGDYVKAEMVKGFLSSAEYRKRFGLQ